MVRVDCRNMFVPCNSKYVATKIGCGRIVKALCTYMFVPCNSKYVATKIGIRLWEDSKGLVYIVPTESRLLCCPEWVASFPGSPSPPRTQKTTLQKLGGPWEEATERVCFEHATN